MAWWVLAEARRTQRLSLFVHVVHGFVHGSIPHHERECHDERGWHYEWRVVCHEKGVSHLVGGHFQEIGEGHEFCL